MSRPKCLRCGAGAEWIEGKVPDEPSREAHSLQRPCSTSRLNDAIENAKRKAVDEINALDWHEGDLRKWNIVERAIRSVIAEMSNEKVKP